MFASWVRPFCSSRISVLVGLPLTTNVPLSPAAMLAPLSPTMSRFTSTRWLVLHREAAGRRRALGDDQDEAGERDAHDGRDVAPGDALPGARSAGSRPGPDRRPRRRGELASSALDRVIDKMTATTAPGTTGANRLKPRMMMRVPAAKATVQRVRVGDVGDRVPLLLEPVARALRDAEHAGDLPGDSTWMPTPVRKPISTEALRKSPRNPSFSSRARISRPPQTSATRLRPGQPLRGVRREARDPEAGEAGGQDRRGRGVRTDHEQPGRPEQGEDDRREDDRVEPRHHRRLGDGGVAHRLRDRDSRERHTGDEVTGQPRPLVALERLRREPGEHRHDPTFPSPRGPRHSKAAREAPARVSGST